MITHIFIANFSDPSTDSHNKATFCLWYSDAEDLRAQGLEAMVALDYDRACEYFRSALSLSTRHTDLALGQDLRTRLEGARAAQRVAQERSNANAVQHPADVAAKGMPAVRLAEAREQASAPASDDQVAARERLEASSAADAQHISDEPVQEVSSDGEPSGQTGRKAGELAIEVHSEPEQEPQPEPEPETHATEESPQPQADSVAKGRGSTKKSKKKKKG